MSTAKTDTVHRMGSGGVPEVRSGGEKAVTGDWGKKVKRSSVVGCLRGMGAP